MSDAVILESREGVVTVTLNRPKKRNAIDGAIIAGLLRAQLVIGKDRSARVVVLAGAAMGGGLNLAMGADMRVVSPNAKLGFVEISFGLLPDKSATQSLRHLVGLERAKELILTGRKFTGVQAYEYGLVTTFSDNPKEEALEMARTIAGRNPEAVRAGKKLLNDAVFCSTYDGLVAESNCSRELLGTPNQIEAVVSTFERRDAQFSEPRDQIFSPSGSDQAGKGEVI